jgi:hypothetical protein
MMGKAVNKPVQLLTLQPDTQILFNGPFTDVVTTDLRISNQTDKRICFKVKTNCPQQYFVRPNGGLVEPNSHSTVNVMLQPINCGLDEVRHHKLMIQSIVVENECATNGLEKLWKQVKADDVMETKLNCVFEQPIRETRYVDNHLENSTTRFADHSPPPSETKHQSQSTKLVTSGSGISTAFFALLIAAICIIAYKFLT